MVDLAYFLNQYLIFILFFTVLYLTYRINKSRVFDFILASGLAVLISEGIKYVVNRPRPDPSFEGSSFPSSHTSVAFVAFFFYLFCVKNPKWLSGKLKIGGGGMTVDRSKFIWSLTVFMVLLEAVLVGLLRVYVGAHYLTDVVAGIFVGFIAVLPFIFYDVSGRRLS